MSDQVRFEFESGSFELEFEGPAKFARDDLPGLLRALTAAAQEIALAEFDDSEDDTALEAWLDSLEDHDHAFDEDDTEDAPIDAEDAQA